METRIQYTYIYIYTDIGILMDLIKVGTSIFSRRGHPQSAVFWLFSYTCTDSFCLAHLQWQCHYYATINNFCLASLQWLNKTKKTTKWQDPTLCHYSTLGVCNLFFCFFVSWYFCFFYCLVSCFLVRCCFFEGLAKQHESEGPRPNSLPVLPLQGFANLLVVVLLFALGLWFH